ncbi:LysM peptidoglycan-binding domain-containing protein [Spirochaetales bacterium BR193]|uniref:LysM peptidoglycan-binding domain-containing protein n=2 Tax=Entomospira entomophila TaxID=2719988 RepID=A0A968G9G0_9SPIO|nr:LysM peptidoglycan-binding domain-containing protein [Entomospira entomophilus]
MIDESILPYEQMQAQELQALLSDIATTMEDDEEAAFELWQEFTYLLQEYDDLIDMHLALYHTIYPSMSERDNVYLLAQPLATFHETLRNARIAYSEAALTDAIAYLQEAQELWRSIEQDTELINLLDMHLETALNIELLSRRFARGEDKLFHKPSPWVAQRAESMPMENIDIAPQFIPLHRAITLWEQATIAAEASNYEDSLRLLAESQEYLQLYAGVSFSSYHTVELNVSRRESLWRIAEAVYGDGFQWTRIWEANRDILSNPNRIYPGQQLGLPEVEGNDEESIDSSEE